MVCSSPLPTLTRTPLIAELSSAATRPCTAQSSIARTLGSASSRRRTWPSSTGREASSPISLLATDFSVNAMTDPADIADDVAAPAAGGDHLVGPAGKERLDHLAAARQKSVRVAALRHALARDVVDREMVPLQHGDRS